MTTVTEINTTQIYQVFIKATPEQVWEGDHRPGVHAEVLPREPDRTTTFEVGLRPTAASPVTGARTLGRGRGAGGRPAAAAAHDLAVRSGTRRLRRSRHSRVTWEIEEGQDGGFTKLTVVHDQLEESLEDGGERRRRLELRPQRTEDGARDRRAARRLIGTDTCGAGRRGPLRTAERSYMRFDHFTISLMLRPPDRSPARRATGRRPSRMHISPISPSCTTAGSLLAAGPIDHPRYPRALDPECRARTWPGSSRLRTRRYAPGSLRSRPPPGWFLPARSRSRRRDSRARWRRRWAESPSRTSS